MLIIIEMEKLFVEWRIIGQDAGRVVIDMHAAGSGFDDDAILAVGEHPVQFGRRELSAKRCVGEIELLEESASFGDGAALAENPGDELELGNVGGVGGDGVEDGVAGEKQASHTKAFFVDGIIEKWVVVAIGVGCDKGDADDGEVRLE